jgi:hypothetical protein
VKSNSFNIVGREVIAIERIDQIGKITVFGIIIKVVLKVLSTEREKQQALA